MRFKQRVIRLFCYLLLGFAVLFGLRLGYGYVQNPNGVPQAGDAQRNFSRFESVSVGKKNYASSKYEMAGAQTQAVDQKYEKTATVQSASAAFTEDEKKTRAAIANHSGIIQFENGRGTAGSRVLYLHIGVQPASFDAFREELAGIGRVLSMDVAKTDKTNEFLALKAKRASLEKTRTALVELKAREGKIEEYMNLQDRILSIESELQGLGVQLGEFDEVNAFCTVRFSLAENVAKASSISLGHRLAVAFYWTAQFYAVLLTGLFGVMLTAFVALLAVDKFNLVQKTIARLEENKPQ